MVADPIDPDSRRTAAILARRGTSVTDNPGAPNPGSITANPGMPNINSALQLGRAQQQGAPLQLGALAIQLQQRLFGGSDSGGSADGAQYSYCRVWRS
jgi:hypothetical protein